MYSMTIIQNVEWVAIGDSITALNDHPEETGNRVNRGYLTRVREKLPYINYVNQGHNGWSTVMIGKEVETLGIGKADVYTILLGTNDWWEGRTVGNMEDYINDTGLETFTGAYRKIINKLRSLSPSAKIILITPMQRNDFVYVADARNNALGSYQEKKGQSLELFANAVTAISKYEKLTLIDLYHHPKLTINKMVKFKRLKDPVTGSYKKYKYPEWLNIPFNPVTDDYPYPLSAVGMTYDGLHPSDKGNSIIAASIVKTFRQVLSPD